MCTMNSLSTVKKGGLRPSKHTQQTTESSVLQNYNPIGAVKKISEEAEKKKKKEITVITSSNFHLSNGLF